MSKSKQFTAGPPHNGGGGSPFNRGNAPKGGPHNGGGKAPSRRGGGFKWKYILILGGIIFALTGIEKSGLYINSFPVGSNAHNGPAVMSTPFGNNRQLAYPDNPDVNAYKAARVNAAREASEINNYEPKGFGY